MDNRADVREFLTTRRARTTPESGERNCRDGCRTRRYLLAMDVAVRAEALRKSFGSTKALDGLDLDVPEGTILGLLGPNGAGKTTAVRVLTTLLIPDSGRAYGGRCGRRRPDPTKARRLIGLTGQFAALDDYLNGRENLIMFGRLYHLGRAEADRRADELLERFDLTDAAGRLAKTYSGRHASPAGHRGVTDLPATGALPRRADDRTGPAQPDRHVAGDGGSRPGRHDDAVDHAVPGGSRPVGYSIAVIDAGRVIAEGTSNELKAQVGGTRLVLGLGSAEEVGRAVEIMRKVGDGTEPTLEELTVCVPVTEGAGVFAEVVRDLDGAGVQHRRSRPAPPHAGRRIPPPDRPSAESADQPQADADGESNAMTTVQAAVREYAARRGTIFGDSWVMTIRLIKQIVRVPDLLVFSIIQPVLFVLLFRYVFGGSIDVGGPRRTTSTT